MKTKFFRKEGPVFFNEKVLASHKDGEKHFMVFEGKGHKRTNMFLFFFDEKKITKNLKKRSKNR